MYFTSSPLLTTTSSNDMTESISTNDNTHQQHHQEGNTQNVALVSTGSGPYASAMNSLFGRLSNAMAPAPPRPLQRAAPPRPPERAAPPRVPRPTSWTTADRPKKKPRLTEEEAKKVPFHFYRPVNTRTAFKDNPPCVCLEKYQKCERMMELPCGVHRMHRRCGTKWMQESATCPYCRVGAPCKEKH